LNDTNGIARWRPESLEVVDAEALREHKLLRTAITVLDRFLGAFEPSKLSVLDSSDRFLFDLVYTLCTRAVIDFNASVVYVDGGNHMDPYVISGLCKRYRADKDTVLSRINVARAFTAYQMVTIIESDLERTINEMAADVVVASCLSTLFQDEDLGSSESRSMYRQCIAKLKELTGKYNLITIITNYARRAHTGRRAEFKKYLYRDADKIIRFERREERKALRVWDEQKHSYIEYHPVPWNQAVLEDFLAEDAHG